jgi:Spy/CpxP family protein refolding chaperone
VRRIILPAVLVLGTMVFAAQAQQEPSSPPPPPPPSAEQAKPKPRQSMTDEQRAELEQRLDAAWGKMSVEGKTRLMRLHRALSEMPPEERKFIHDHIERFLNMSPAEREKLKQNKQQWEQMSPEQRQIAREEFRARRQEFEERWRHEHPGEEPPTNPSPDPKSLPPPPPAP